MDEVPAKKRLRNNPLFVITIACLVAVLMTITSLVMYYNSNTRVIVQKIQENTLSLEEQSAEEGANEDPRDIIEQTEQAVIDRIDDLNNEADFSAAELTDAALGL